MDIITYADIFRFFAALLFVVGLMALLAYILRRINNLHGPRINKKKRLSITEVLQIDQKRKALLLRCDNHEHLVILGAQGETVVATGIEAPDDVPEQVDIAPQEDEDVTSVDKETTNETKTHAKIIPPL